MRADRLIALLTLLQSRGKVTVAEAAAELETSQRTARRDLEALALAGVPVYSTSGRGGGWQLVGGARTDLSGLTAPEVRSLFLALGATSSTTPEGRAALRKLQQALPGPFRETADRASTAVLRVRPSEADDAPAYLDEVTDAVVRGQRLRVDYTDGEGNRTTREVDPLGLVSRYRAWYLLCQTEHGRRTLRVDRITAMEVLSDGVRRPPGFDLEAAWAETTASWPRNREQAEVIAVADEWVVGTLFGMPGLRVVAVRPLEDGSHEVRLEARSLRSLTGQIAGFTSALRVIAPPSARAQLRAIGLDLRALYRDPNANPDSTLSSN